MFIIGIALLIASACSSIAAMRAIASVNFDARVPYLSFTPGMTPVRTRALMGAAGGLSVLGAAACAPTIGYWSVLLVIVAFVPSMLLHYDHNRRIADAH